MIYFFSTLPLIFSVSILIFYFHAAKIIGHLPRYNQPDPKELEIYEIYHPIINFTGNIWIYSFLIWLILIITFIYKSRKKLNYKLITISIICQVIPIIIFFTEILEWYAD